MNVRFRQLKTKDYPAVVGLLQQLGYQDNTVPLFSRRCRIIKKHNGIIFVAENDAKAVIGFAALALLPMVHCDGFLARILDFCIDENERSTGIGTSFVHFIESYCVQKDCVSLEVTTRLVRQRAHQFYLFNGFLETHKHYNKPPNRA